MSKFVETLHKVGQHLPEPLGFGPASSRESAAPHIMLIGKATAAEIAKDSGLLDASVDAILVESAPDGLDAVTDALKDKVWGVMSSAIKSGDVSALKEKGCDFIVFDAAETDAAVLNDEDLGKVLTVNAGMDEHFARAAHGLAIDATLFVPDSDLSPLTIQKLIEIEKVNGLFGKPFIMGSDAKFGADDLEAIRDGDVAALLVGLASADDIAKTKEAISELPRAKQRSSRGDLVAQAPSVGFMPPPPREEEPEEGDEDDF